ncbi:ShlB/FhaC/HecB family hemolysin secretion/activation protein [Hydromonas duriensis]|uniref:Hemolysin activation/secretion protein n=1 Tax=Hydromonas duriensis TaxID=1527608 RepID=A0A4R6Y2R2_9BURK|nr:ShlB/FhaC/HecB family hemolysin secretion/activation protein [Hydromonas duriensis]TDR30804.1 hemolysin activation/secretion protein [Hydromonas duriensis]
MRKNQITRCLLSAGILTMPAFAWAQTSASPTIPPVIQNAQSIEQRQREQTEQLRLQQQQEQEQRSRVQTPNAQATATTPDKPVANEGPCFALKHIIWQQTQGLIPPPLYLKYKAYRGIHAHECLNQAQIIQLQKDLSNALIEHGHITSKINFPAQNIASGQLTIDWYPGTVAKITHDTKTGQPIGSLDVLFPNREGQLYNQRQADQALENLKRLSSQGNATIELQPGEATGTSNIVYKLEPKTFLQRINGTIGFDNAGSKTSGQYQANGSLSIDSPLHLNDQLTLNYNHNADASNSDHNTETYGAYWGIATGYGTFDLGYNKSSYLQTVAGYQSNLAYTGNSQDFYASAGFMLHRSSNSKTQAAIKLGRKISHNLIDDTEIPIQMRDYVYTDMGLNHTQYHKDQQYTIGFNVRQNLPSLSKSVGYVYGEPDWNGKWRVYTLNASATIPFKLGTATFRYNGTLKAQRAKRPTPGSELFSLGSRYTVRGFDESFSISGEDGVLIRNEWAYLYGPDKRQQVYLGIDWGKVKGPATEDSLATSLMGSALGVRGYYKGLNYDLALGLPIKSPKYISHRHDPSFYGSISYQF